MKHIKTIAIIACLTATTGATAQTAAEEVKSPIVESKPAEWYDAQTDAWAEEVKNRPSDESAWLNYYKAAYYRAWYKDTDSLSHTMLTDMQKHIGDTYTYYYCAYRDRMGTDDDRTLAEAAIARMPQKMGYDEYNTWACYFAKEGDTERLADITKAYYQSGLYSPGILQYNYNELQGMDDGGIYLGVGDALVIPKWLLQNGLDLHKDKILVCVPFLNIQKYREQLFRQLAIGTPPEPDMPLNDDQSNYKYVLKLIDVIRQKSGRPIYYSPLSGADLRIDIMDSLYNEGLLLKYSDTPYDNMAAKRRNVEERYMLEYLMQSFTPDRWAAGSGMLVNYVIVLNDLLPYYKQHNAQQYERLKNILTCAINRANLSLREKEQFMKMIDK